MLKYQAIIFFLLLLSGNFIYAEDAPARLDRTLSLSSGYLDRIFHSNEGLSEFPISVFNGFSRLYDFSTEKWATTPGKRTLGLALSLLPAWWLSDATYLAFHEFGHARAVQAFGGNYSYKVGFYNVSQISNYWGLSLWLFLSPPEDLQNSGAPPSVESAYAQPPQLSQKALSYYGAQGPQIIVNAGGINNSTFLANKMSEQIYRSGGHVVNAPAYFFTKLDGLSYTFSSGSESNDILNIIKEYHKKGYHISKNNIAIQYALGLLSGTSLAIFKGIYDYLAKGDPQVHALEWWGIRFPEFNSYLNARGLSLEVQTSYRLFENILLGFGYEWITMGDFTQEFSPKINLELGYWILPLKDFWLAADARIGHGLGGSMEATWFPKEMEVPVLNQLSLSLRWTNFNRYTLFGERNSPSFTGSDNISEWLATLRYHY